MNKSCNKRITAKDVALEAGVSRPLVSMYLAGNPKAWLSEETKARIDEAVKKLNYRPNLLAQSLKSGKTKTVGMVMGGISNSFSGIFGEAVMKEVEKYGYRLFLALTQFDRQREHDALTNMIGHQIDGVIYTLSVNRDPEFFRRLADAPMPVVLTEYNPQLALPCVAFDLLPGVRAALQAVREAGMSKVLYITGCMDQEETIGSDVSGDFPDIKFETLHWNPTDTDLAATLERLNNTTAQAVFCPQELLKFLKGKHIDHIRLIPITQIPDARLYDNVFGIVECPFQVRIRELAKILIALIEGTAEPGEARQRLIGSNFYPLTEVAGWCQKISNDPDCRMYCNHQQIF